MVQTISKAEGGSEVIAEFYNRLKLAQTREELLAIVNLLCKGYDQVLKGMKPVKSREKNKEEIIDDIKINTKFNEQLKTNPDLVISIATKKIISNYYLNKILSSGKERVNELENLKMSGVSIDEILEFFGESFNETSISNGIEKLSKKIFSDTIDVVSDQLQTHLCWEHCVNASVLQCPKIADQVKQKIGEYDFITDGYQIFDANGKVDQFIVTGCDNYVKAEPKVLTSEEKKRLKIAKESLRMAYFDASSLEEAYLIQADLEARGQIHSIRGRRPDEKTIKLIKARRNSKNNY